MKKIPHNNGEGVFPARAQVKNETANRNSCSTHCCIIPPGGFGMAPNTSRLLTLKGSIPLAVCLGFSRGKKKAWAEKTESPPHPGICPPGSRCGKRRFSATTFCKWDRPKPGFRGVKY